MKIHGNQLNKIQGKVDFEAIKQIKVDLGTDIKMRIAAEKSSHLLAQNVLHEHQGRKLRKTNNTQVPSIVQTKK